jgi:Inorganic Pyrophosphatase/Large polyvalent protein associated domain 39
MADDGWTTVDNSDINKATPDNGGPLPWSDYGKTLAAGTEELGAGAGASLRALGESAGGDPTVAAVGKYLQKYFGEAAEGQRASMTEAGRARGEAAITSPEFWAHPLSSLGLKATGMAPAALATMIPGGIAGDAIAGTLAVAAAGGAINHGQTVKSIYDLTDKLPDKELQDQVPYYQALRSSGMEEKDAREAYNDKLMGAKGALAFLVGAAAGVAGPAGTVARGGVAGAAESGIAGRVLAGGAEGAGAMGVQSGVANVTQQEAAIENKSQKDFDTSALVSEVLESTVMGGLLGAATGVKGHKALDTAKERDKAKGNQLPENVGPPLKATAGASIPVAPKPPENVTAGQESQDLVVRSETNYGKKDDKGATGKGPTIQQVGPGEPDAAMSAAVSARQPEAVTPESNQNTGQTPPQNTTPPVEPQGSLPVAPAQPTSPGVDQAQKTPVQTPVKYDSPVAPSLDNIPTIQAAQTGIPEVDRVLNDPVVSKAITNRVVDNTKEIPYTAAASLPLDNPKFYMDKDFPQEVTAKRLSDPTKTKTFKTAEPMAVHENVETDVILKAIALFKKHNGRDPNNKEMAAIYDHAHLHFGEVAEDAWYKAHDIDPKDVDRVYQPFIDKIQKRKVTEAPPADMFRAIYPDGDITKARAEPIEDPETLKSPGRAAAETDTNPTEAQKKSGKYKKGVASTLGQKVAIETPRGATRKGVGPDGKPWEVVMPDHYGEIQGTKGADGDKVDAYISRGKRIFVIDQKDLKTNKFDEHKVMLGYPDEAAARSTYEKGFSDGRGAERIMGMREMTKEELAGWLKDRKATKEPASEVTPASKPKYTFESEPAAEGDFYTIKDQTGKTVAHAQINMGGKEARVLDIYSPEGEHGKANSLGFTTTREILRQFKEDHPGIETVTGKRVSGSRSKGKEVPVQKGTEVKVSVTPESKRAPRVLEDISPEGKAAREEAQAQELAQATKVKAENKQADKVEARENAPEQQLGERRSHDTKAEKEAIAAERAASKKVFDEHETAPAEDNFMSKDKNARAASRAAIMDRVQKAVGAASDAGVEVRKIIRTSQTNEMAWLSEAKNLADKGDKAKAEDYVRFKTRDNSLRRGGEVAAEARAERKAEGDMAMRRDEGDTESAQTSTRNVKDAAAALPHTLSARTEEAEVKTKTGKTEKVERAIAASEVRKPKISAEDNSRLLAALGVASKRNESVNIKAPKEARLKTKDDTVPPNIYNPDAKVKPIDSTTLKDVLERMPENKNPIRNFISKKIIEAAGDVKIHIVDRKGMNTLIPIGRETHGYYDATPDHIIISDDLFEESAKHQNYVLLHEAVHAATSRLLDKDPVATKRIQALMDELKMYGAANNAPDISSLYAFTNEHEFLAEAMSNKGFQDILAHIDISPEMAKRLDIANWRKATLWDGLVSAVRRMLGIPEGSTSALEAAMSLTERAMMDRLPGDKALYAKRDAANRRSTAQELMRKRSEPRLTSVSNFIENTRDSIHDALEHPSETIRNGLQDLARQPDAANKLTKFVDKFTTNEQKRQWNENLFKGKDADNILYKITDTIERRGVESADLKKDGDKLGVQGIKLTEQYPEEFANLSGLLIDETMHGVDASSRMDVGRNAYLELSKTSKNNLAKGKLTLKTSEYQIKQERHQELRARYNALPEPLKAYHEQVLKFFEDAQSEMTKAHLDTVLKAEGISEADRPNKVNNYYNALNTEAFRDQLNQDHGEVVAGHILKAKQLSGLEGPYVPLDRRGEHVVSGKYKVDEPANKVNNTNLKDGSYEFKDIKDAHEFAKNIRLDHTMSKVYYDPGTNDRTTKVGGISQSGTADERYEVRVNKDHVEFFDSLKKAQDRQEELHASGMFEKKPIIEEKKAFVGRESEIGHGAVNTIIDRLKKTEQYGRATPAQRTAMEESVREGAMVTTAGNKIQQRRIPRRNVQGASEDFVSTLHDYNSSQANYRANIIWRPDIERHLEAMDDEVKASRYKSDGTIDPDGNRRSQVANEFRERARAQDPSEYSGKYTNFMRKVMTWSYVDRMARVSHLLLHQTHLPMITVPTLAARHGLMRSYQMMGKVWKDAFGVYGAGWNDTLGAIADRFHEGTDYTKMFTDLFSKQPDGQRIGDLMQRARQENWANTHSMLELHKYNPANMPKGLVGVADHWMNRLDTVFRQSTNATEAINRFGGTIMAYRLEYENALKKGLSEDAAHEAAIQYARRTIGNTQGFYSATNAAPIFKNKIIRPFLQFKQFPQMMYHLLASAGKKAFTGATKEDRVEGAKQLAYVIGAHVAATGLLGGLPLEAAKITGFITKQLGVTSGDWSDAERKAYELAVAGLGKTGADYLMHGVARHLTGVDLHHRLGLNSFVTFGMPDKASAKDVSQWIVSQALGAPGSTGTDMAAGLKDMLGGDFTKGALKAVPLQVVRDWYKAGTGEGAGGYQYSPGERVGRALGFTPAGEAEQGERKHEIQLLKGEYTEKRAQLMKSYVGAAGADRAKAMQAISSWNASQTPASRITSEQLQTAAKRKASTVKDKSYLGVPLNKQTEYLKRRDQELYQ